MKNDNFITLNLCVNEHGIIFLYVLVNYLLSFPSSWDISLQFSNTERDFWPLNMLKYNFPKGLNQDFPSGSGVKNLLPMQGTWVRCLGATKSVHDNSWACTTEPMCRNYWAHKPQLLKPAHLEPVLHLRETTAMRSLHPTAKSSPCSLQLKKAHM